MDIISNCPLCEEYSLHVLGKDEAQMMQCISCGYVSTTKFIGKKEENEHWSSHILVALPTTLDAISNIEDKTLENVVGLTHVYLVIDIESFLKQKLILFDQHKT